MTLNFVCDKTPAGRLDHGAYLAFLQSKFRFGRSWGFDIGESDINPMLKPHQRDIVRWAVKKGRAAIFAAFGLGKSFMDLEASRIILSRVGGNALIVCPLGVRQEFMADAAKLGIDVQFIRHGSEVTNPGIYLTNYEAVRDGRVDVGLFKVISLDEASVLRSYGSKTYQEFLTLCDCVPYRFVYTATPSPNRYKELIHYAAFLGVMDSGQALTRFFQRDSSQANNLTLYPHMEREFFLWLHSWAAFVQRPSDLGHDDTGYDMPELIVYYHELPAGSLSGGVERDGQGRLIKDAALGLREAAAEKKDSIDVRVAKMLEIVQADPESHYILWHTREAERHAIKAALPSASEVFGTLDLDERERRIVDFSNGETQYLATKPEISGSGCNFQRHCHKAIFIGVDYFFNDLIQAVHRIRRFLQEHQCEIHIIHMDTEREILKELQRKWREHDVLTSRMSEVIAEHGLSTLGLEAQLARTIGVDRQEVKSDLFHVANNDCVLEVDGMIDNSVDMICTSIPFGNHYEYTSKYNDFGHNEGNRRFFDQMDFLTPGLLRVLRPGRVAAIHVKDRVNFGNVTGYGMPSVEPFHVDCINHYIKHGFIYFGMITVVTDVVRENNQTYRLGYTEMCKDGTKMGVGSPEYVLLFRKLPTDTSRGYADIPVTKDKSEYSLAKWQLDAHSFWRSSGDRLLTESELRTFDASALVRVFADRSATRLYDYHDHVAIGEELGNKLPRTFMAIAPGSHHPDVWHDVQRMITLNSVQARKNLAMHVCPLQIDVVDRLIERFTTKGETVFDPFGGIGTVPYCAMKTGRKGRSVELNGEYFADSLCHLREMERNVGALTLFDVLKGAA